LSRLWQSLVGVALAGACCVVLASCSSVLSELPTQAGGLPEGTPQRAANAPAYPAVHDMPPPRANAVLTEDEKKRVEAELAAMREQQAKRAASSTIPE
jgi:hypothetical protein